MEGAYVICIDWSMVLDGLVWLFLALGSWSTRAHFNRTARAIEKLSAKMDQNKAELIASINRNIAEVLELINQSDK